jgi:ABC-type nitrate/sulfonate/bicarbonate transport system substrate-binding protein
MKPFKSRLPWAVTATLVSLFPAICGDTPAFAQTSEKPIRIATARGVNFVALWGIKPFAEKYGLRTEMVVAVTNADQQRAVQSGSTDLASLGYQSPAIMAEQGISNVKILSGIYVGGQNLVVRKGETLASWKDLEGKRIGVAPGTFAQVLFVLAAETNGVDVSKIKLVNVTAVGTAELQALKSGELDGLVLFSPTVDRGVVDGYAYYPACCDISSTKTFAGWNQVLAANSAFLQNRQVAVNFLKAFAEAESYYSQNRSQAVDVIAQFTGIGKDVADEALKHAKLEYRVDIPTAIAVAKQGPKFGFTRSDMSGKVPGYFDLSYLAEATGKPESQLENYGR